MATLYLTLLTFHNLNRWLILLAGVWALVRTIPGASGGRTFTPADRRPVAMFMGTLHLQVVLGLLLFAFMGMQNIPLFAGAPRSSFQWEHLGLGALAAVFGTLASVQSRKAPTDPAKFRAATLWTALSLVVILLAIPWWRPLLRVFTQ
ncbi:hypothetical protein LAJ19_07685 [Deinococcus taeanensis]|uniref:hypothetical protein n=1 Tax=Deinococcus taeanensis TaxID=2737050 RepID=UPI001CDCA401|nr:hypothetical protein [Deinococcus taeanensis]UBV41548.1 hypothetical protein LAJ19_07685 [Deinococcus taeanensis]